MNYVRFFYSLFLGSLIILPVMVMTGREVEELNGLEDYVWIPILVALISLFLKTIFDRKNQ